jgi:hypothetical protein
VLRRTAALLLMVLFTFCVLAQNTPSLPEPPPILPPTPNSAPELNTMLTAPRPNVPQPGFRGSQGDAVRVLLGLFALFGLAYLGGHPRVQQLERRLAITHLVTAGLPYVLLGLVASLPQVGILSESVLYELRPLLVLGLGWIGFTVGFRFDANLVKSIWPGVGAVVALTSVWPFALVLLVCGAMLWTVEPNLGTAVFIRDGIILGTAGAMTAATATDLFTPRTAAEGSVERVRTVIQLEEFTAVIGLMLLAAYFRSEGFAAWKLPGTAWLFITIGMGATMGAVVYAALAKISEGPEFTVLMLGSVSFTAGMASFLRISPIAVCFIAGAILVNLPGGAKDQVREALNHLERPIYLLFLIVAGSLWRVGQWQGWVLMVLFVIARFVGKWLAMRSLRQNKEAGLTVEEQRALMLSPLGALSIAIVVSAEDLYFSPSIPWIVTAVIAGAIVTEIVVQAASRGSAAPAVT